MTGERTGFAALNFTFSDRDPMKKHERHPGGQPHPHALNTLVSHILPLLLLFLTAGFLCCCAKKDATKKQSLVSLPSDFNSPDSIVGVVSDTSSCFEAKKAFPQARFREYETVSDAYPDLENGTISAIAFDRPVLEYARSEERRVGKEC